MATTSRSSPSTLTSTSATAPQSSSRFAISRPDVPRFSRRTIALCWLSGLIISLGWDRALWLAVTSAGVARFQWLETALSPSGLLELLNQRGFFAAAIGLLYAAVYFFGRLWLWLALGIALVFRHWLSNDTRRVKRGLREGVFINLVPLSAGLSGELLKLVTRRVRPETLDGHWGFKPPQGSIIDPSFWSTGGLSMASSHASVAIGAALAAGAIFPRFRIPLLLIAALCCLSRLLVGAHYLSDVYVGASLGLASFYLIRAWDARNNAGVPIDAAASASSAS